MMFVIDGDDGVADDGLKFHLERIESNQYRL